MANQNVNSTQSYGGHFESAGSAVTLTLPFDPDTVKTWNYTQFGTTAKNVASFWSKDFPAGDALIVQTLTDSGATGNVSGVLEATNGFTSANVASDFTVRQKVVSGATVANPVVVTATAHTYSNDDRVTITGVGGMVEINNQRFRIANVTANTFELQDENGDNIDGTNFTAYSAAGQVVRVGPLLGIQNPAPVYKVTLGTAVAGANSDEIYFEAFQYGQYTDLGDQA